MTNQEKVNEAQRLLATGNHQDRKKAKKLLESVEKENKKASSTQQGRLF